MKKNQNLKNKINIYKQKLKFKIISYKMKIKSNQINKKYNNILKNFAITKKQINKKNKN